MPRAYSPPGSPGGAASRGGPSGERSIDIATADRLCVALGLSLATSAR
jgi:hypothetical protein